jgi:PAS domain S-box-containing protein
MDYQNMSNSELFRELQQLKHDYNSLKELYESNVVKNSQYFDSQYDSSDQYNLIEQGANYLVFCMNIDETFMFVNEAYAKVLNKSQHEIVGKTFSDFYTPDQAKIRIIFFRRVMKSGVKDSADLKLLNIHGEEVSFHLTLEPIKDANNKILWGVGVISNITERRNVDNLLRVSESKFRKIYEDGPYGIALVNNKFMFITANATFCNTVGYSEEELLCLTFKDITYSDDVDKDLENVNKLINKEILVLKTEKRYIRKDGEVIWCSLTVSSIYQDDGTFLYNVAIINDITERKKIEFILKEKSDEIEAQNEEYMQLNEELSQSNEELSQTNEELLEAQKRIAKSEEKFRKAFFINPDAITINRIQDGMYTSVNQGFTRMFGYSETETIGKTSLELNIWQNPEERKAFVNLLQTDGIIENLEVSLCTKEGTILLCLVSTVVIEYDGISHILSVTKNITARKEMELDLIKAKDKAEESDRLKTAFLQNMSHEIRTPMNAIMGFSALLHKQYNNKAKLEYYSNIINRRCADLLDIINEVLDVAKIESGQLPVNTEECKMMELFSDISLFFQEYQKRQNKQHIIFNVQINNEVDNLTFLADKVKLKQILINIIGNAFKFTEQGFIQVGCEIEDNQFIVFRISDTGIGIPEDKRSFIFERFTQLESTPGHLYGGTGLGLSIVKGLVDLLSGQIWLTSELGKGSTFYFKLPYKTIDKSPQKLSYAIENKEFDFCNKTMLIVEDDKYNADYLIEILNDTGLDIIHTFYGIEAVQIATTRKIDIVLMDIRLPDIDGYLATQLIRKNNPNVKIVAQTAYASQEDKEKAIFAGCNDYISKPILSELLLPIIKKQLE